jgi:hypothetical protein
MRVTKNLAATEALMTRQRDVEVTHKKLKTARQGGSRETAICVPGGS